MALDKAQNMDRLPFGKARWKPARDVNFAEITSRYGTVTAALEEELAAARTARSMAETERRKVAARKKEEQDNIERAKITGAVTEWYDCTSQTSGYSARMH